VLSVQKGGPADGTLTINAPWVYHKVELDRLSEFLSGYSEVAVVEGDVGLSGVSVARLSVIAKTVKAAGSSCKIIIGAAYKEKTFELDAFTRPNPLFGSDFEYTVLHPAKGETVRRVSEVFSHSNPAKSGNERLTERYLKMMGCEKTLEEMREEYRLFRKKAMICEKKRERLIVQYRKGG